MKIFARGYKDENHITQVTRPGVKECPHRQTTDSAKNQLPVGVSGNQWLLGSQQANQDRDNFFRAQILFWLMAAIDGHAKNYSLFLEADSAYRMAPLYDVLSAYPLMAQGSIPAEKVKALMDEMAEKKVTVIG